MVATEVSLSNRALSAIGTRSSIQSLQENSNEARQCALLYAPTRDYCLQMARWNFARKMATLTLLKAAPGTPENQTTATVWNGATMPQLPWLYSYARPSDALQIHRVPAQNVNVYGTAPPLTTAPGYPGYTLASPAAQNQSARFQPAQDLSPQGNQIEIILTNVPQALVVYTVLTTNPQLFDSQFQEALVNGLAGRLAIALSGDKAMSDRLYVKANDVVKQARESDANEGLTTIDHIPDWIQARGAGANYWDVGPGMFCEPYGPFFA